MTNSKILISTSSESTHVATFCTQFLSPVLMEVCGVDSAKAEAIGCDVLVRAEALAALDDSDRDTLIAPFIEDVSAYEPRQASARLKAAVAVVVRNSLLEDEHAAGLVNAGGLEAITTAAAAPLSHLLAARRRQPLSMLQDSPFVHLPEAYPRAWTALRALANNLDAGGRHGYRSPDAPIPSLPDADDIVAVRPSKYHDHAVVQSAIDPAFNQQLFDLLKAAIGADLPFYVTSLSRISRNADKLLYVIELLLSHNVPILTTNYLLRGDDVWVRRGTLVIPDSYNFRSGLDNMSGLSGAHRKMVEGIKSHL